MRQLTLSLLAAIIVALVAVPGPQAQTPLESTLITNVTVVDGTGAPAFEASVRIRDGIIAEIGEIAIDDADVLIDGLGLVLAPGFIDTHSHLDGDQDRGLPAAVTQGVTTVVVGQDGRSRFPLADFFEHVEEEPFAVNIASYVGHNTLRARVMGDDFRREATEEELAAMRAALRSELESGALGLSTGLEYDPGIYASTEEVIALAREVADVDGHYISHIRSEDRYLEDAIEEIIQVGREADVPVQISHMKLARISLWGEADRILKRLDEARDEGITITADVYPYTYWQSSMTVLFPERNFDDRAAAEFALTELTTAEDMIIARFEPDTSYVGLSIAEVAALRGTDPVTTYMELIRRSQEAENGGESVIARSMHEDDVATILQWPHTNVSSDGSARSGHPRGWGAFPRVLRQYVRETGILTLEKAIHKMTGLPAQHVGLGDRGVLEEGAPADLVLFDPETIADRATIDEPDKPSVGIEAVWVNGASVYENGGVTKERPGKVLRRQATDAHRDNAAATSLEDEEAIREADEAERRAMLEIDFEALSQIWADDFIVTSAQGDVLTKQEILYIFEAGRPPYSSFERDVENVRFYGNVAVSTGHEVVVPVAGPRSGESIPRRYTHVWVKREGTWQLVARHAGTV